jgi:hypothetical protein
MFVPLRSIMLLVTMVAVVAGLSEPTRPAHANSRRVIAVPAVQALSPEVADIAARATSDLRRQIMSVESLRVTEGPPVPPGYQSRVPPFALWREAHVDFLLTSYARTVSNRPVLQVRIWDIATGGQIVSQVYVSEFDQRPVFGDEIAGEIRDVLTAALDKGNAPVQH